jgi:hypothetical protein
MLSDKSLFTSGKIIIRLENNFLAEGVKFIAEEMMRFKGREHTLVIFDAAHYTDIVSFVNVGDKITGIMLYEHNSYVFLPSGTSIYKERSSLTVCEMRECIHKIACGQSMPPDSSDMTIVLNRKESAYIDLIIGLSLPMVLRQIHLASSYSLTNIVTRMPGSIIGSSNARQRSTQRTEHPAPGT